MKGTGKDISDRKTRRKA